MTRTEKALAWGGGLIVAVLVGLGIYEETKKPAALPSSQMVKLTQGRRYSIAFTCPSATASPSITALSGITLVGSTPNSNGSGGTIVVDYTGTSGTYPVVTSGCSITVTDVGPAGGGVAGVHHGNPLPIGGIGGIPVHISQLPAVQNLSPAGGSTSSAQAVTGGTLNVTAPWQIAEIFQAPQAGGPIASSSSFGPNAIIKLSGNTGKITILQKVQGNPALMHPMSLAINVA